jgi:hypothetical protein
LKQVRLSARRQTGSKHAGHEVEKAGREVGLPSGSRRQGQEFGRLVAEELTPRAKVSQYADSEHTRRCVFVRNPQKGVQCGATHEVPSSLHEFVCLLFLMVASTMCTP